MPYELEYELESELESELEAELENEFTGRAEGEANRPRQAPRSYLGGSINTLTLKTLPVKVSVFSPKAASLKREVEVLVYAHGLLGVCEVPRAGRETEDIITAAPFKLGEIVDSSKRGIVLVVPFFGRPWTSQGLGRPAILNRLVDEVLAEVGRMQGTAPPSLSNLILAGHSRAYAFLEPLARSYADSQMRQGALAKLSQVWAFDTTYVCDINAWTGWLTSKPNLKVRVFFRKTSGKSGTAPCGWKFYAKMKGTGSRLRVTPVDPRESHCALPIRRLAGLLTPPNTFESRETENGWPRAESTLERELEDLEQELETGSPYRAPGSLVCPTRAQVARDRCLRPGTKTCPAIPNLLCLRDIAGVPFEYVLGTRRDPTSRLTIVSRRKSPIVQRFIPSVRDALNSFVSNMSRFGMPIEAILTLGSLYCRCVTRTDTLSNHSFGDAIDVAGVRWPSAGGPASAARETVVYNWRDGGQRVLLRRINACLRLTFNTVIDYHRPDHRDHFHCDTNSTRGSVRAMGRSTTTPHFVQESLTHVLRRPIKETGSWDRATMQGLRDFSGVTLTGPRDPRMNEVLNQLFTDVASGKRFIR